MKRVDKLEVDEERWREATERAAVIRPLIAKDSIEAAEAGAAILAERSAITLSASVATISSRA